MGAAKFSTRRKETLNDVTTIEQYISNFFAQLQPKTKEEGLSTRTIEQNHVAFSDVVRVQLQNLKREKYPGRTKESLTRHNLQGLEMHHNAHIL